MGKDADDLTLEREIRIEPGQQQVEVTLWSPSQVPVGDWEINVAFSVDGADLPSWQGQISVQDLTELDIEADWPSGSLAGSLRSALNVAGIDWSRDYARGYLGSAFAFSMKKDGGPLWQEGYDEWLLSPQVTSHLEHSAIDASQFGSKAEANAEAWEQVRRAIDDGYPAVVRMRDTGNHQLPGPWSLIVGYDEEMETYTVHHAGAGAYTTRETDSATPTPSIGPAS